MCAWSTDPLTHVCIGFVDEDNVMVRGQKWVTARFRIPNVHRGDVDPMDLVKAHVLAAVNIQKAMARLNAKKVKK